MRGTTKTIHVTVLATLASVLIFSYGSWTLTPEEATEELLTAWSFRHEPSVDYIRYLIGNGADVNALGSLQRTPLGWAAIKDNSEVLQLLVENGADVNARNNMAKLVTGRISYRLTPLMLAAANSNTPENVALLLDNGAEINAGDGVFANGGCTPLIMAAAHSDTPEIVELLLERGAEVNRRSDFFTPLMFAAMFSSTPEIVALLLQNGAELEARTESGNTALLLAAAYSSTPEIVAMLIEKGAELEARSHEDCTPLLAAAWLSYTPEIVALLIDKGAELEAKITIDNRTLIQRLDEDKNEIGSTPLLLAISRGEGLKVEAEIIALLLEKGANINAVDTHGRTPLFRARWKPEIKKLLIEAGATE